ncbi:MAG TPA: acetyltransferase [Phenylobacterium sp.]|jgi:sugar O-acyltransferase (sialic acid O-acetyltransferase NeuD family)|uniref:acetyltransferase n=1 Tax=Phenylobacterium sp. TaxID=1871053 RepID=UPI002D36ED63|nr:acetyltransferase [Phenylobacterium sp.]HZZ68676.1 acetyltransferase [Phenylobacterium sp.]
MPAAKPLVIVGNGEIAEMACEYFDHDSDRQVAAFAIGADYIKVPELASRPVVDLASLTKTHPPDAFDAFVAIGDGQLNRLRRGHVDGIKAAGYALASYVSSRAFVWHNVTIGENCFILEHNVLQPFTRIGDNVTLWSGNHIGHRSVIEDDVFMASHVVVSGFCRIGARSFVGVNAAMAAHVEIAPDNFIAMGAAVTASTEPDSIYMGVPAERRTISAKRFCRVRE